MKHFRGVRSLFIIPWIIGGLILASIVAFLFGLIVMWLWNWIMPDIFGLAEITYWQGWALVLLSHILFKSNAHKYHNRHHHGKEHWKDIFRSKFRKKCYEDVNNGEDIALEEKK